MDSTASPLPGFDRQHLFVGSCVALIATAVAFATVGASMLALKREFILTNARPRDLRAPISIKHSVTQKSPPIPTQI